MAIPEDLPLAGIRVAEFGQFIAAPGAAMMLADLGADVIKVEPLRGDSARRFDGTSSQSPMFLAYNRGKRGMALDLRQPAGAEAARRLAFSCDVVLHNARPGTMESIGLDAATLRTAKPALIHASVTGFGTRGPSRLRPGLDIAAQAESGMMSVTGEAGGQPLKAGFALIDAATALATSNAILAALFRRLRTGQGETIETSLLTVGIQLQAQLWSEYQCSGALPVRSGNSQPKAAPAADVIAVADGHIVLSAYLDEHWARLCDAIGQPALARDPRFASNPLRVKNRPALLDVLHAALRGYTGEQARALLERHQVVVGVVRDYQQVERSADVLASGLLMRVGDGLGGEIALPGLPFTMASLPPAATPAVPRLGEHTAAVLRELGYDDVAIRTMAQARAIAIESLDTTEASA
ncbi:Crotonobetainyl-CoA:carnitine CoA-transferase CaiB [Cupriavidus sp. OV038]|jgi:crotonobetainyl-CoA:carnitine CoA-transferase CaiB-like acyl-CoA transferase|uniref:CaiB/BaiF CoA transferase family protein n=1 Tax=unclassified Cupriavidus TaxID=2640874 RepID=UPI0008E28A18|nr:MULTISPECIES: CoA transferase [unclassified Cupriavidus]SFC96298.1 Crotonobetainyl-CoA:carnitine CoA-transferase CaiB [Cupriavidus sp. OV038]SFP65111.1 Crotonobetainyl-CoA:carnitine CoA-transferase CaiB [Cupriavidus sp. OV096]